MFQQPGRATGNSKGFRETTGFSTFKGQQKSTAVHTDSKITLDAIANPMNHRRLVEQIRGVRRLEKDNSL